MRIRSLVLTLQSITAALLLLAFPRESTRAASDPNQGWVEVRTAHFTVATNAGEKDGRRIANQFEQIRAMFHSGFPNLRVDPAQPILILAAKNESTMKPFVPEDWSIKGHAHHAGMYQEGQDKHYVIMRLDAEGTNPFHTLYHEYTHALLHLNFSDLPLWLDEGLAEFFGNSTLGSKESYTGTIDQGHLYLLSQNKLLPIETLLEVDHQSPYYNEANRASVFYAESWAVVHYLMVDPDAHQKQLLGKFFQALEKSGNQLDAAREAFGDLKSFGQTIDRYVRQSRFQVGLVKNTEAAEQANYSVRALEPVEALALRADFFSHSNQFALAKPALEQALQLDQNLPFAHEAMGYYKYRTDDFSGALTEMRRCIELGSKSFVPFFYQGLLLVQGASHGSESNLEAIASLQKAAQMNPQFAPAFETLAQARMQSEATKKDAVGSAVQAVRLDPGSRPYRFNLAYALISNNRDAEARIVGEKLLEAARTPEQTSMAQELLNRVSQHEQWLAQVKAATAGDQPLAAVGSTAISAADQTALTIAEPGVPIKGPVSFGVDGVISEIDCAHSPEITMTLKIAKGAPMTFHIADFRHIMASAPDGQPIPKLESCKQWPGRQAKVWFRITQGQEYLGEISKIHFF